VNIGSLLRGMFGKAKAGEVPAPGFIKMLSKSVGIETPWTHFGKPLRGYQARRLTKNQISRASRAANRRRHPKSARVTS
jgi:hypothetical protein